MNIIFLFFISTMSFWTTHATRLTKKIKPNPVEFSFEFEKLPLELGNIVFFFALNNSIKNPPTLKATFKQLANLQRTSSNFKELMKKPTTTKLIIKMICEKNSKYFWLDYLKPKGYNPLAEKLGGFDTISENIILLLLGKNKIQEYIKANQIKFDQLVNSVYWLSLHDNPKTFDYIKPTFLSLIKLQPSHPKYYTILRNTFSHFFSSILFDSISYKDYLNLYSMRQIKALDLFSEIKQILKEDYSSFINNDVPLLGYVSSVNWTDVATHLLEENIDLKKYTIKKEQFDPTKPYTICLPQTGRDMIKVLINHGYKLKKSEKDIVEYFWGKSFLTH